MSLLGRYFTLLAVYPPEMIVGVATSHAQHAADKVCGDRSLNRIWLCKLTLRTRCGRCSFRRRGTSGRGSLCPCTSRLYPVIFGRMSPRIFFRLRHHARVVACCDVTELWCCARWSQPITALQRLLFPPIFPLQTAFKHFDSKRIRVSCFALTPSDNSKFRRLIKSNVAAGDFHDV